MNSTIILILVVTMIPIYISLIFIPYWTRKTESFGVSIPEEAYYRPEIKKMRKKYAWLTTLLALIMTAVFWITAVGHNEDFIAISFSFMILVYIVVGFYFYIIFHRQMKELKLSNKEWQQKSQLVMVNTGFRNQKLAHSNYWFIIPFLISIITTIITLMNYRLIPDRIPMNYNFSGEVTSWTNKSYRSVLLMPSMQVYLTLLFLFINIMISKAKQQVSAADPEASMQQNVIFRRRWSFFMIISGIALIAMFTVIQLSFIYPINSQVLMIVPFILALGIVVGSIILSFTTGQGGSRVAIKADGKNETVIDRDDDRYWKLGMFYFNRNDPAIFLEKRFGIGWTNNWAHPLSWIFILVIILLAVGLPLLLQ